MERYIFIAINAYTVTTRYGEGEKMRYVEEYGRETYMPGVTVKEIAEELTHEINCYHKHYDYITIFSEEYISYFKVVNDEGKYKIIELV